MRTQFLKIAAAVMVLFFIGTGVSLAKDRKGPHRTPPGHAYRHYKQPGPPAHAYGPRYSYHNHYKNYRCSYPVVVQRYYYSPPVYYVAPAPTGYFFGMSAYEPGLAFSFGVSGR
jgi:hypothetical protein